ncbi:hypothetical protein JL722_11245 [Aureococcus anophagefferens]|nr:hypothetical protein JL722_11245 [Aureococcus anophagefferens]
MAVPFEGLEATQAWLEATLKRNVVDAPGPVYDDEEVIKIAAVANPFLEWALRRGDAASYAARWADHYGGLGRAIVYRAEDLGDLPNVRHFIRKTASQTGRGVVSGGVRRAAGHRRQVRPRPPAALRALVNYGHHRGAGAEHFLTLREPADRFESMLTMRLAERKPRLDWPGDRDLLNFAPFRTFGFYASDKSTILCRPGDAFAFLDAFGVVDRDPACAAAPPAPAKAARAQGRFSEASRDRIRRVFADDTSLWRRACA